MERKSFFENISEARNNFSLYLEKKISLYALIGLEKAAKFLTIAVAISTVILFMAIFVIFVSVAAAIYVGKLLESMELGYLAIAGLYFLLGIVFFAYRKKIFGPLIIGFLVDVLFKDDEDDQKNNQPK